MWVIDSHTEGEPTRVIMEGGPDLGSGTVADKARRLAAHHDDMRRFAINEPRGHEALVGALLCESHAPDYAAGVIFFNNAGYLGMCGHATIGLAVTLARLGRIGLGRHRFETPVGIVTVDLVDAHTATIENVESYRLHSGIELNISGLGHVTGDVAWGGNWFFLSEQAPCDLVFENIGRLTLAGQAVMTALRQAGISGKDGAVIDHVEFFSAPVSPHANSRNFVLCPGGAYDRSPCGTGTSAKLACLAADGKLKPDEIWVQESIIGSTFKASYRSGAAGAVIPSITGRAFVCADTRLLRDSDDPFAAGIA